MAKNPTPTTKERLLAEIEASARTQMDWMDRANQPEYYSGLGLLGSNTSQYNNSAILEASKQAKLKDLLAMYDESSESGATSSVSQSLNPFGSGGSGGAPTMPTGNRFEAGLSDAETRLRSLLDNPDSINQSAAYKFRVNQGQEALQRSLGAKGLLNSGNRLMELTKYGQDMGSQEYDNQFGRIKDLVGGYSGSWIGDKNANTGQFNAQANAWNTAQAIADRNRLGFATLDWEKSKPQGGGAVIRSSGGGYGGFVQQQPSTPIDPWSYNMGSYDGTNSWYTNDKTGAQMARRS